MKHCRFWSSAKLALAFVGLILALGLVGCSQEGGSAYARAQELERKLLMHGREVNYSDQGFVAVAAELQKVPPWSSEYGPAREKLERIKQARRLKAGEVFELEFRPSSLEGRALTEYAVSPPQAIVDPKRPVPNVQQPPPAAPSVQLASADPVGKVVPTDAESAISGASTEVVPAKSAKKGKGPKVILYTTSWCGFCKRARSYFKEHGVAFEDKDVERDQAAGLEAARKSPDYGGVPLIDIDGTIIQGFDVPAIERALAKHK